MKLKKWLPILLAVVALASVVIAIVLFAVTVPNATAGYKRVLGMIAGILFVLLALLIGYYFFLMRDTESNFFLFDRAKKKNIPVENLTFAIVNEKMNFYLTMVCDTPEQLWQEDILERERMLGYRRVYRPLLAYKMLYDLADKKIAAYWELLINAKAETVNSLCSALEQAGEQEMVKAFRFLMDNYRDKPEKIKDFVEGNCRYIRGKMIGYVKKNIELFY